MPQPAASPVMLEVRPDRPAGVVRAILAATPQFRAARPGDYREREIGTIAIQVADEFPAAFAAWVAALAGAVAGIAEQATGGTVVRVDRYRPGDLN